MKEFKGILSETGAGLWGTDKLRKKLQKDTPGQPSETFDINKEFDKFVEAGSCWDGYKEGYDRVTDIDIEQGKRDLKKKKIDKAIKDVGEDVEINEGLPNQKQLEKDIMAFMKNGRSDGITGLMGVSKSLEQKYRVGPAVARTAVKKLLSDIVNGTYKG
jgi:hypothetical protein